ncbi:bone morphogenic protein 1 [Apostichopus japonicus]|uniref:Bone morphogenic protein 1 n=1 Tax=Stichopus japonicus TaxID=307972 RepID=A0A2G8K975_STIJA|nr:bone morphogenic protein 1 [Apostichopus japonicus]
MDECENNNGECQHTCINTLGSYMCTCRNGFTLHENGHDCKECKYHANGTCIEGIPRFVTIQSPQEFPCSLPIQSLPRNTPGSLPFGLPRNSPVRYHSVSPVIPRFITIQSPQVYPRFVTIQSPQEFPGFLPFSLPRNTPAKCQKEITDVSGVITSPNFPDNYPKRKQCSWHIIATPGHRVELENGNLQKGCAGPIIVHMAQPGSPHATVLKEIPLFDIGTAKVFLLNEVKYLQLKAPFSHPRPSKLLFIPSRLHFATPTLMIYLEAHQECAYDHVRLYDGDSDERLGLGTFCGHHLPDDILSSGNHMFISFYSDASVSRPGFSARHRTVCGGTLMATHGQLSLYSHAELSDGNYPSQADCLWTIIAPQGWTIRFWFVLFDIELETECGYDYVEIEEGFETLGKYCGERLPPDIVTNGDELTIHFVSDDTIHRKGFHAKYQLDDEIVYDLPNE